MTQFRAFAVPLVLVLALACALPPGRAVRSVQANESQCALALATLSVRAVDDLAGHWWTSLRAPLVMDLAVYESVAGAVAEARVELRAAHLEIQDGKTAVDRFVKIDALMHFACADLTRLGARPSAELTHALAVVHAYAVRH